MDVSIRILYTLFSESNPVKNNIIHVLRSYLTIIGKIIDCTSSSSMVHFFIFDSNPYITYFTLDPSLVDYFDLAHCTSLFTIENVSPNAETYLDREIHKDDSDVKIYL